MARTPDQPISTDRGRRRRDDLLAAARSVFEELGYANTTVSEIVRVSGGSRASFYSYFASADDALHELVDELAEQLFEASTESLHRGDTPIETLTDSIRQFMHAYRDRAALLGVLDQATATSEAPEFVPLCSVELALAAPTVIKNGPSGMRMIAPIEAMRMSGERLNGTLAGPAAADWLTIADGVATIDVRATIRTEDDATIFVQYRGRSDASQGMGTKPVHVAATFETDAAQYAWLNPLLAVGRGELSELRYEWFEVR